MDLDPDPIIKRLEKLVHALFFRSGHSSNRVIGGPLTILEKPIGNTKFMSFAHHLTHEVCPSMQNM